MTPSKNDRERSGSNKGKKDASSVESNTIFYVKFKGKQVLNVVGGWGKKERNGGRLCIR